eukprot:c20160_g1_i1.p1 GENE.c20160_g1_i1~~c20160_g1_i1.p1  ORF type:complete len:412 (-),score=150.61 c20160_g1_i1:60-1211(-)
MDMDGYCNEGIRKTEVLATQPAPIQAHILVYPATMGAEFIQYFISDKYTTPPELYDQFDEKMVIMPHSYFVNSHNALLMSKEINLDEITEHTKINLDVYENDGVMYNAFGETRSEFGLPSRGIVFCSFNSHYKFDPFLWDIWMDILRLVDGSVLWLLFFPPESAARLIQEAKKRGVDGDSRIVFSEYLDDPERNLARLKFADIVLDTFHYGAHTGCADSLFVGVPIVTLTGTQFAARVCTGQLHVIEAPQLIAKTVEEYKKIAIHLATDKEYLNQTKKYLESVRKTTPLFDTGRYVKNLERGYLEMWNNFLSNNPPRHIHVDESSELIFNKQKSQLESGRNIEKNKKIKLEQKVESEVKEDDDSNRNSDSNRKSDAKHSTNEL